jgi:hypothetical protein
LYNTDQNQCHTLQPTEETRRNFVQHILFGFTLHGFRIRNSLTAYFIQNNIAKDTSKNFSQKSLRFSQRFACEFAFSFRSFEARFLEIPLFSSFLIPTMAFATNFPHNRKRTVYVGGFGNEINEVRFCGFSGLFKGGESGLFFYFLACLKAENLSYLIQKNVQNKIPK